MVINQFHSIGDILFIEPICRHFWKKNGEKPILPVRDHLLWMADYIESADFRPMSKFELDYESLETSNPDYLPLRFANQIVRGLDKNDHSDYKNCMPDKYILAGLDLELWKTMRIKLNMRKTAELLTVLGLGEAPGRDPQPFVLVNEYSQAGNVTIKPDTNKRIVKMRTIEGFTVLDWAPLIVMADENHHVSTSTFYIMQAAYNQFNQIWGSKIFLYPRPNEDGLQGISKLNPDFTYEIGSSNS